MNRCNTSCDRSTNPLSLFRSLSLSLSLSSLALQQNNSLRFQIYCCCHSVRMSVQQSRDPVTARYEQHKRVFVSSAWCSNGNSTPHTFVVVSSPSPPVAGLTSFLFRLLLTKIRFRRHH